MTSRPRTRPWRVRKYLDGDWAYGKQCVMGCSFSSTIVVALGVYIRSIQNIMSSSTRPASAPGPTGSYLVISFSPNGIAIWNETYQRPVFVIIFLLFLSFFSFISNSFRCWCILLCYLLLYSVEADASNCILGPTVVSSGSALASEFRPGSIQDDDTKCNSSGLLSYHHVCDL